MRCAVYTSVDSYQPPGDEVPGLQIYIPCCNYCLYLCLFLLSCVGCSMANRSQFALSAYMGMDTGNGTKE